MGGQDLTCPGHVAGSAGRTSVVHSRCPGTRSSIPIILIPKCSIDIPVLGFHIDLNLGMIRSQMTLSAGLRFSGFHDREPVSGMAAGATAQATVQIDPAYAHIGPGLRI